MKEMQFLAIVLMTLLTMKLLLLPRRAVSNPSMSRSRWLLVIATALLAAHFLLQYRLELRLLDVNKAVMVNLAFFIPCAGLFSLAILYLLRQGRVSLFEKYVGVLVWLIAMALLLVGANTDFLPLRVAEMLASFFYAAMQLYYTFKHIRQLRITRQTLANYYDIDMNAQLSWMQFTIVMMVLMALFAPIMIFEQGWSMALFGTFFFAGIFYLVDSFCLYAVSADPAKVMEAEQNEEAIVNEEGRGEHNSEKTVSDEALQRVERAVAQWTAAGGHLKSGLKLPNAAEEMQIPRYLLSIWLKQSGRHYSEWLAELRIQEAKRTLRDHPEWSNEAVAQHCGFSDRCYFQKVFKEMTGMTPAQFLTL